MSGCYKTKLPGGGLTEDYFNSRVGCSLRLTAHCALVPRCVVIYLKSAPIRLHDEARRGF